MFHVVLYQPEIPPNTGNVMRLCANTGCRLHLIEPLAFALDDSRLKRAGLDYVEWAEVKTYSCLQDFARRVVPARLFTLSTRNPRRYDDVRFTAGDAFVFGPETRGLPATVRNSVPAPQRLRLPMHVGSRSLNLSNAVAAVVYEAWRQNGFCGAAPGAHRDIDAR